VYVIKKKKHPGRGGNWLEFTLVCKWEVERGNL